MTRKLLWNVKRIAVAITAFAWTSSPVAAEDTEAAPAGTVLLTAPAEGRPADGAAGREALADEKRQRAATAHSPR